MHDKWNIAHKYSKMLIVSSFTRLFRVWNSGLLVAFPRSLIAIHVPIGLCQILSKTLSRQLEDGSWHRSPGKTAYSILLLSYALVLPCPESIRQYCQAALSNGRRYIEARAGD